MNKKWFLLLASLMLSAFMVAGCGANDDPSPPVDENQDQEQAPIENDPLQDAEDSRDDIGDNKTNDNNTNENNNENDMENPVDETKDNMKSDEESVEEQGNNGNDEKDPNSAQE
jgi:hypothetical protein